MKSVKMLVVGLVLVTILVAVQSCSETTAPALSFKTIDGRTLTLQQLQGRPVLVNFWASSCLPCLEEIPLLKAVYQDLHPQGLEIIAVAMAYDPPNRVLSVVQRYAVNYPVVLDLDAKVIAAFGGVRGIPTSFLITPQGRIAQRIVGVLDRDELYAAIRRLL